MNSRRAGHLWALPFPGLEKASLVVADSIRIPQYRRCRRLGFNPWVKKIPWRRKWQPTPVILAWEVPWMEEPGGLGSMGLQRVRCEWTWACVHERISPALLSKSLLEFVCENITVPASFKHRLLTAGHRVLFAPYIICYDISIRTGT